MSGLYIHIPFCRQKCRYCDFASFAGAEALINGYLSALEKEASFYLSFSADTLYIGGGTPSLLSSLQLEKLCGLITQRFAPLGTFQESTLEANPESLTKEKLRLLKDAGLNRLSLGLQSFDDGVLKRIGRVHDVKTFLSAYGAAREEGFDNISVDLIAGLPGQKKEMFLQGLKKLTDLKPEHISVYGLQVEEGTPFYKEGVQADEDLLRAELEETHRFLQAVGYIHYEISNFALPGRESRHNLNYWQNGEYLGLGSAAASYLNGVRRGNVPDMREYMRRIGEGKNPAEFAEKLTGKAKEGEAIMLGLRMLGGVWLSDVQKRFFAGEIQDLVRRGLVEQNGDFIKLTFEGMFLANQAFMAFVGPFEDTCG